MLALTWTARHNRLVIRLSRRRAGLGCRTWSRIGSSTGRCAGHGFIFRCAFRLDLLGDEAAFGHQPAFDEGLCAVLESVGESVAADVADRQILALLFENEVGATIDVGDRAGAEIAGNAHALVQR